MHLQILQMDELLCPVILAYLWCRRKEEEEESKHANTNVFSSLSE